MTILKITQLSGQATVLGTIREFRFNGGELAIVGLDYNDVQRVLEALGRVPMQGFDVPGQAIGLVESKSPLLRDDEIKPAGGERVSVQKPAEEPAGKRKPGRPPADKPKAAMAGEEAPAEAPEPKVRPTETVPHEEPPKDEEGAKEEAPPPERRPEQARSEGKAAMNDVLSKARAIGKSIENANAEKTKNDAMPPTNGKVADLGARREAAKQERATEQQRAKPAARKETEGEPEGETEYEATSGRGRDLTDDADESTPPPRAAAKPPAERQPERAATNGTKAGPANTNGGTNASSKSRPASGDYVLDPSNIPKEVYEAKSMRGLVKYFVEVLRVTDADSIYRECNRLKDQITMFARTDLKTRIESALELMPAAAT